MKNKLQIIINSDDFGLSDTVNKAIVGSFERGLISSTTLMANMPGFEDAVNYAQSNALLTNKIGLHMNLTEGKPLTDPIKKCSKFCNAQSFFIYDRKKPMFVLSREERHAVFVEIQAQIARLIKHNIKPTHLDSHHHVHTEFAIMRIYLDAAREFGIRKMRASKNIGKIGFVNKTYKSGFNFYLRHIKNVTTTDFFCSANEFNGLMGNNQINENASYEVMVHAKLNSDGQILDIDDVDMGNKMREMVDVYRPVSYFEI